MRGTPRAGPGRNGRPVGWHGVAGVPAGSGVAGVGVVRGVPLAMCGLPIPLPSRTLR